MSGVRSGEPSTPEERSGTHSPWECAEYELVGGRGADWAPEGLERDCERGSLGACLDLLWTIRLRIARSGVCATSLYDQLSREDAEMVIASLLDQHEAEWLHRAKGANAMLLATVRRTERSCSLQDEGACHRLKATLSLVANRIEFSAGVLLLPTCRRSGTPNLSLLPALLELTPSAR